MINHNKVNFSFNDFISYMLLQYDLNKLHLRHLEIFEKPFQSSASTLSDQKIHGIYEAYINEVYTNGHNIHYI